MRLLYKFLLGAIIFNSMLVLFSVFFIGSPASEGAINVSSDATYAGYKLSGDAATFAGSSIIIAGVTISVGAALAWLMKSPVPIGVAIFSSVMVLFTAPAAIIYQIGGTQNYIVVGIIEIIAICIGILAFIAVAEMFTQQGGGE